MVLHEVEIEVWVLGRGAQTMSDSLMYRLTYYNFADASTVMTGQRGYDRVRQAKIGLMDFKCAPALPPLLPCPHLPCDSMLCLGLGACHTIN